MNKAGTFSISSRLGLFVYSDILFLKKQSTGAAWKRILPKFRNILKRIREWIHSSKPAKSLKIICPGRFSRILPPTQFITFNSWKVPWNWIDFYQNSFVESPDLLYLLYKLIRRDTGRLANKAFSSNPIVFWKQ